MTDTMDRALDPTFRRRRLLRRLAITVALAGGVAALLFLLPGWLRPTIPLERLRVETVDRGPVESVIEASGTVIPAFEKVLSSPVEARVERILKRPGAAVAPGDEILELDTSAARLELERTEDRLAQKRNERERLEAELDGKLAALAHRAESLKLDAEIAGHRLEQARALHDQGLLSESELRQAEVEAKKAEIELRQVDEDRTNARRENGAALRSVGLDLQILQGERDEAKRRLELATTRADRPGVVTWTVPEEGATVQRGETIARIADLDSFRVEGTVSDLHSARLTEGLPVHVLVGDGSLDGTLSSVHPTIENGVVHFTVDLAQPTHPGLRNNLRVDVLVVTGRTREALRIPKGPFARAAGDALYVVEGSPPRRAVRRPVRLGVSGFDFVEVASGLAQGERVIVSDMSRYDHLDVVDLRD